MRRRPALGAALVTLGGFVVAGLFIGWLWSRLAHPAHFTVTQGNGVMDEVEAARQFGVTVTYTWLSAVGAVLWAAWCSRRFARLGWPMVPVTVVGAAVAAVISWRLGIVLGPPDASGALAGAAVGSRVPEALSLPSHGVLFVWPVAATIALLVVVRWFPPRAGLPVSDPWRGSGDARTHAKDPQREGGWG